MRQNQSPPKGHQHAPQAEPARPRQQPEGDERPGIACFEEWRRSAGLSLEQAARVWAGRRSQEQSVPADQTALRTVSKRGSGLG